MEGFVGKQKDLEMDVLWDGEPVEVCRVGGMWSRSGSG